MSHVPTILICDDEVHILHVVALKLQDAGYATLTAASGSVGLALAQQHRPALVITDYLMPKLDGLELCRALRSDPQTKAIDLILLSARGGNLPEESMEGLHLSAIFSKPFSPRELVGCVKQLVPIRVPTELRGVD